MENKQQKLWVIIIFFGGIWGLIEATVGYGLQFLPPFVSGIIMFPIAIFILMKAYRVTGLRRSLVMIGLIAAAIKGVNLFLPGLIPFKTINPMVGIMIESMVVALVYPVLAKKNVAKQFAGAAMASMLWRGTFVVYMYGVAGVTGELAKWLGTFELALGFIVINGILAAVLVQLVLFIDRLSENIMKKSYTIRPAHAMVVAILATVMTFVL